MNINLRKIGCAAIGSSLFLGGVYLGRKLTIDNISKNLDNIIYGAEVKAQYRRTSDNLYVPDRKPSDIIFTSRNDAYDVWRQMLEIINDYGFVSVSELYELSGFTSDVNNARLQEVGWRDLEDVDLKMENHGYSLNLPEPIKLKGEK